MATAKLLSFGEGISVTDTFGRRILAVACSSLTGDEWGGEVRLVDAVTAENVTSIPLYAGTAAVAIARDVVVAGADDGNCYVFRLTHSEGKTTAQLHGSLRGHGDIVSAVAFHPAKPGVVASASWDNSVRLWECGDVDATGGIRASGAYSYHTQAVNAIAWSPEPDCSLLSAGSDGLVCLWDGRLSSCSRPAASCSLDCPLLSLSWRRAHTSQFAVGTENGTVAICDTRKMGAPLTVLREHKASVRALAFCPFGGDILASGSDDGSVRLHTFKQSASSCDTVSTLSHAHKDYVRGLCWITGDRLASTGFDRTLQFTTVSGTAEQR